MVSGATPRRDTPEYWDGDISWVTPKDLTNLSNSVLQDTPEKISAVGLKSCSARILPKGSVLFSSRAPIGLVAIAGRDMATNQGFKSLVPGDDVDSKYLYWCMKHMSKRIQDLGRGATFTEVSKSIVEEVEVPVPPLDEQRRIAAILDKADALRRKRAEALKLTDQFLQSTFLEMFGDPVTNPKGWDTEKLGNLCRVRRGASPRPISQFMNGTVPWIKIGDCTKSSNIYVTSTAEHVTEAGKDRSVYLEPGSLIFANCGVSLGFARILRISGCIHDGWLAFDKLDPRLDQIYLLKLLNSITEYFRRIAPDGTQPNLNTGIMKNCDIPLPPMAMQSQFEEIVFSHDTFEQKQASLSQESVGLFDSLVQRAFRGEL